MSEKEKKSGGGAESSLVLVEKSTASRHKQPFRPNEMQEDAPTSDLHKRSKAPAVPSVAEEFKESVHTDNKDRKESLNSEAHLHSVSKKISASKKRSSSPEAITLAPMQTDAKRSIITPSQPIPAQVSSIQSATPDQSTDKGVADRKDEEDSITEEIAELRTPEVAKKSSEWSDDEEAGGLPRTESRASRVSRAMRQLFCCGVQLESPSEHRFSPRSHAI